MIDNGLPIISPWLLYYVNVLVQLRGLAIVITGIGFIIGFVEIVITLIEGGNFQELIIGKNKGIIKACVIVEYISMSIVVLVPDKDTLLTMLALQYITPENIDMVQGNIVDFINQLFGAVERGYMTNECIWNI